MTTRIRSATKLDRGGVRDVHLRAFPEGEGRLVARLATDLLNEETDPATVNLVAESGGEVVGHIAFSPVTADAGSNWSGYILAPLGVRPGYQNRGIGSRLVESGMERITEGGVDVLFVYGDPGYYGRFGFRAKSAAGFIPPCKLQYPHGWQATVLRERGAGIQSVQLSCVASLRDPALW